MFPEDKATSKVYKSLYSALAPLREKNYIGSFSAVGGLPAVQNAETAPAPTSLHSKRKIQRRWIALRKSRRVGMTVCHSTGTTY